MPARVRHAGRACAALPVDERGLEQQVLGRVAGDRQLGEGEQVGARARARPMRGDDPLALPSRSPTVGLIWARARRRVRMGRRLWGVASGGASAAPGAGPARERPRARACVEAASCAPIPAPCACSSSRTTTPSAGTSSTLPSSGPTRSSSPGARPRRARSGSRRGRAGGRPGAHRPAARRVWWTWSAWPRPAAAHARHLPRAPGPRPRLRRAPRAHDADARQASR